MIMNLRKFLGLQTSNEILTEYKQLKDRFNETIGEGQMLSERFMIQKSIIDDISLLPSEEQDKVYSKYNDFVKEHSKEVSNIVNERSNIMKSLEKIRLNPNLSSICADIDTIENITTSYRNGMVAKSTYFDILKSLSGQPTKYADAIVTDYNGRILVLHRATDYMGDGTVCIPGGHVDNGEDFMAAAIRELKEETNLDAVGAVRKVGEYKNDDADIEYFFIQVDSSQPVTLQGVECCFCEWVPISEIPTMPFIHSQGDNVFKILTEDNPSVNLAIDSFKKGKMSAKVCKKITRKLVECKSMSIESATPLMPESLEMSKKKIVVVARDPDKNIERVLKSVSGLTDGVKIGGRDLNLTNPVNIHEVKYKSQGNSKYLVDVEIVYSGEMKIMAEIMAKIGGFSMNDLAISTPHENFMLVNSYGTDYIGDPVFADL